MASPALDVYSLAAVAYAMIAGEGPFSAERGRERIASQLAGRFPRASHKRAGLPPEIDDLLKGARPPGYANQPKSHNAVAAAIAQNRADWGVAIEPVAKIYGLGFLPVAPEHYDFLVVDSRRERPAVQAFIAALLDNATREHIAALGMEPA